MSELSNRIAVKRDGPRGWHYIAREHFNPKVHEPADPLNIPSASEEAVAESAHAEQPVAAPASKPKRRKAKK